jgi:hypothetical protein
MLNTAFWFCGQGQSAKVRNIAVLEYCTQYVQIRCRFQLLLRYTIVIIKWLCRLIDWLWWGETMSQNCGHQRAYRSSPEWYVNMEKPWSWWWWWCRLGITPDSSTRALWQSYQQRHVRQVGGMDEGVRILFIRYLRYLKGFLTRRKIIWHRNSGFTSHPKESVLRIFIAHVNPSPRPGLNPLPLTRVAMTLTTTPPRRRLCRLEHI